MFDKKNKIKRTADNYSTGPLSSVWHHIVNDWPQAILVAAIVTIMHSHPATFGWFHAIDRYAYVVMGHLSTLVAPPSQQNDAQATLSPEVLVVGIGPKTHKERYLERAPLNRCQMRWDLEQLYNSKPRLVVIDLDLSPVREPKIDNKSNSDVTTDYGWGDTTACQAKLNTLIVRSAKTIKTVLMAPIAEEWTPEQKKWVHVMEKAGVFFASGKLPVEYGVVLSYYSAPGTLSQTAAALWNCKGCCNNCSVEPCDNSSCIDRQYDQIKSYATPLDLSEAKKKVLNFQTSRSVAADKLIDIAALPGPDLRGKVVFFGAAYGEDDYFLTPVDENYGVSLHAAAFITAFNNIGEHDAFRDNFLHFIVDVIFGLTLGVIIAHCWYRYFILRLSVFSVRNQLYAPVWIGLIFAFVIPSMITLAGLSLYLLSNHGIWASPVPIAIGMLFESFVSGSVAQAIRAGHELDGRLKQTNFIADVGQTSAVLPTCQASFLSVENKNLCQSLKRFVYFDFQRLWAENQRQAAFLIALRRLIWLVFVVLAVWSMFPDH